MANMTTNQINQTYQIITIPLTIREQAPSDTSLFSETRWIALENRDGSYTLVDQVLNTTKRVGKASLDAIAEQVNQNALIGGQDVSIH